MKIDPIHGLISLPVVNALSAALASELVVVAVGHSLADRRALVLPVGAVGIGVAHPGLQEEVLRIMILCNSIKFFKPAKVGIDN